MTSLSDDPRDEVQDPTLPRARVRRSAPLDPIQTPTAPYPAVRLASNTSPSLDIFGVSGFYHMSPAEKSAARKRIWLWVSTLVALCLLFAPMRPGVSDYFSAATQARLAFRYDLALGFYAKAHTEAPSDARPLCASGDVYVLQQLPAQAVSAYRACAALAPDDGSAWLRLGDALAAANDDAGSVSAWTHAGAAGDLTAYARLAKRSEGLGQLDDAARWWLRLPQDDEQAQGRLGLLALAAGNAVAARGHLFALSRSKSALALHYRQAGVFILDLQPPASALEYEDIGYALLMLDEPGVAATPLRRAARLDPQDGSARAYYGYTLWLLGQQDAARPEIAAGLRLSPSLPFALYAAGQVAMADHNYGLALARFQTATEVTPRNPALWSAAGDAALQKHDYITAELSYINAAQYSDDPAYTIALVQFYQDHGLGVDDDTLNRTAFAATRRFPSNETLVYLEAQIEAAYGQSTDAYYLYQRAIALDPTDPGPWLALGTMQAASGDTIPAVVDLRTALALQPQGSYAPQTRKLLASISGVTL
ncbi:MAG TPA: tetratricopeptide repeat protein [Ktedonobacterales bacterium]